MHTYGSSSGLLVRRRLVRRCKGSWRVRDLHNSWSLAVSCDCTFTSQTAGKRFCAAEKRQSKILTYDCGGEICSGNGTVVYSLKCFFRRSIVDASSASLSFASVLWNLNCTCKEQFRSRHRTWRAESNNTLIVVVVVVARAKSALSNNLLHAFAKIVNATMRKLLSETFFSQCMWSCTRFGSLLCSRFLWVPALPSRITLYCSDSPQYCIWVVSF